MLKRLYIAIFVVTLLWALRTYQRVSKERTPASPAPVTAPPVPSPSRGTASEPDSSRRPAPPSEAPRMPTSRAALSPEDVLARKRRGVVKDRGTEDPKSPPLARYAGLALTAKTAVGPRQFLILGARAVRAEDYRPSQGPVALEDGDLRVIARTAPGWEDLVTAEDSQALLVNPSNGRLALVTGAIQAGVANAELAEQVARAEDLTLLQYDAAIGVAFLRAPNHYALLPALKRLGAHPGVHDVELEVVESRKGAR